MIKKKPNKSNKSSLDIEKNKLQLKQELVAVNQNLPKTILILPMKNRPFFPTQIQPLVFKKKEWSETLDYIQESKNKVLGLSFVQNKSHIPSNIRDMATTGCLIKVHNIMPDDEQIQFVAVGILRFKVTKWLSDSPPYLAQVEYPETQIDENDELQAYGLALIQAIKDLIPLNPLYSEELKNYLNRFSTHEPAPLTDFAAAITTASGTELQEVIETKYLHKRMKKVLFLIRKEQAVANLQKEINKEVNSKISKNQREFFLKEQLKIIQRELGISKDDKTAELELFEDRLKKLNIPETSEKKIRNELNKLAILETGSPEFALSRNYLEWATSLPWNNYSEDLYNLSKARAILNKDHDGLNNVKDRIIEFLAVGAFKQKISGSIMLLIGPPGVGKTSIGHSIAKALGRKFYRFSLGGVRDEAEIKGHRRTYIGAQPSKFIQALKEVEYANPVIMLDEIDKIGSSYSGDPASALLEVLDPQQNSDFLDHYLDLRIDLSKVLFICTANQQESIPAPLLDRMEVIRLSGYITEEKLLIAKNHIWPKAISLAGITKKQLCISDAALKKIIECYAREAGVRHLEKLINRIIRKSIINLIKNPKKRITITNKNIENLLGSIYFKKEKHLRDVGVITGLAWTSLGGVTLPIESKVIHQNRAGFQFTGQLGDVMKESASIALNYIISQSHRLSIPNDLLKNAFIHLHVPEGATPKDGPSAGITMASSLLSMLIKKRPPLLAMTGELTLTGHVLAVGGIREKIIAARRQKIHTIIIPKACEQDFKVLPNYIKIGLTVHFANHYDDIIKILFPHLLKS